MNNTELKTIVTDTLAEYAADADKQIIDSEVKEGCIRDLEGAAVFEDLARLEDQSVRGLGNQFGWKLDGYEAALIIATHRVWDAMLATDPEATYEDAQKIARA